MPMEQQENFVEDDDLSPDAKQALQAGEIRRFDSDEDEDDDESYGRRVKKRIYKEISKRKKIEDRAMAAETKNERLDRELREAKERLAEYEEKEGKTTDARQKELIERRDKALEEGELTTYNQLNDELLDLKTEIMERKIIKRSAAPIEQEPPEQTNEDKQPPITKAAQSWIDENEDWLSVDEEKTANAAKIERQLISEGYSVSSNDLYEELDRRLSSYTKDEELFDEDEPQPQRGATTGVPRDQGSRQSARRTGKLTRNDLQAMAKAGLDPNSAKDRAGWIHRNDPM